MISRTGLRTTVLSSLESGTVPKPVSVFDVAAYILEKQGGMSTWKLQKLCYYAQAWSLVWDDASLFSERIEAWANGPVVRDLYGEHRGRFHISSLRKGKASRLDSDQRDTVNAVLAFYGDMEPAALSDMTHREQPWRETRAEAGLSPGERGEAEIPLGTMAEYYDGISQNDDLDW